MFVNSRSRTASLLRKVTLIGMVFFYVLCFITMPQVTMTGQAIGELDDIEGDVDLTAYTFDELCVKGVEFRGDIESMKTGNEVQKAIYYNCKSAQEYYKWLDKAINAIALESGEGGSSYKDNKKHISEGAYVFKPEPNGISTLGEGTTGGFTEQQSVEAWAMYNTVSNQMTRIMARGQGEKLVGDVFGREFDPTNAVTLAAMNTFTMICNTVFNVVAKALMLLFLVQTGFDVLYLVIPALQPLLAPANSNAGGGNAGVTKGKTFAIRFNVVSNEAIDANNRSSTGSVGTNGSTGGGFLQTNIFARYFIARAPLIMLAFTYFVLVATNVWTSIISACTSFITGIFYGL